MVQRRRDAAPRVLRPVCNAAVGRGIALIVLACIIAFAVACEEPIPEPPIVGQTVAQQACADGSCMLVTGRATLDGRPAPAGVPIDAFTGDRSCGATVTGAGGAYTLRVPGEASQSACASPGVAITFEVYGARAAAQATYAPGVSITLDLDGQGETPAAPPSAYCFEPALLPSGFVAQPIRTFPNGRAAEVDVGPSVPVAERPARVAERLQAYARQGRRTGFQWTTADPRFLRALGMDGQGSPPDAQAQGAILRALASEPYAAAYCLVGLYRTEQGAQAAYIETVANVLNPPPGATDYRRVDAPDGDVAAAAVYRSPEWGGTCVYIGVFRVGATGAVLAIQAPSPAAMRSCADLAGPGRLLMWSMVDRIRAQAPGAPPPAPARATTAPVQPTRPSPTVK